MVEYVASEHGKRTKIGSIFAHVRKPTPNSNLLLYLLFRKRL